MARGLILYLHGFRSSPASWKVQELQKHMQDKGLGAHLLAPALPIEPKAALELLESLIAEATEPVTLVGSSLGGYYATWLGEKYGLRVVLINPAVIAPLSLQAYLGTQTNLYTGEAFEFTREHIGQLEAMKVATPTPERYLLLVEKGDEVLDYRHAVQHYAGCQQVILEGGNHSFTQFSQWMPRILEFAGL